MLVQNPSKKRSNLVLISSLSFIAFALLNIILAWISLNAPADSSEFGALRNFALGLYDLVIIIFSLLSVWSAIYLLKLKRWAFVMSVIYLILLMLLLAVSDLKDFGFNLTEGGGISLNAEVLPALILVSLFFSIKEFWKKKTN